MCFISRIFIPLVAAGVSLLGLTGCFTGVEGTSPINLSKRDIAATAPSDEDLLLADVSPLKLKDWSKGKAFLISDDRFKLIVENPEGASIGIGDTVFFAGVRAVGAPGGGERSSLDFTASGKPLSFVVERPLSVASEEITVADVPMLVDLDLVTAVDLRLRGRRLWTKSTFWYDDSLVSLRGRKFIPVEIDRVVPGNAFFPVAVCFSAGDGSHGRFLMSVGAGGNDSRNFSRLFSLSDPIKVYKGISEDNWKAIQNEELRIGMTKEEAKLSRGNPVDVDTGHNYSNAMEIWSYPDGTLLRFVDGLLVSFSQWGLK